MEALLRALPSAISDPYALTGYTTAAIIFVFAGAKLRMVSIRMRLANQFDAIRRVKLVQRSGARRG